MEDALSQAKFGGGLFLSEFPAKIRVLTLDPVVSRDDYGNTRYAFIVWSHDDNVPKILNKGPSFAKRFQEIHTDKDFGNDIRKIDIKITVSGKGKETRYTITPLATSEDLTNEQIKEAAAINLQSVIKNGIRLSEANKGTKVPTVDIEPEQTDEVTDVDDGEPINLDEIPF
jgi:hypothetical protein